MSIESRGIRVAYCRVSTSKSEQDLSLEGQQQQLKAAGAERVIVERHSAYQGQRPGWEELTAMVAKGQVSEVMAVDQSRLSRDGSDKAFLKVCALKGVKVTFLNGGTVDAGTYGGFLQTGFSSLINEAQSVLISYKVKDGLKRRREAGAYACGKVPFGYRYDGNAVVPHPEHWEAARAMWQQLVEREMNIARWIRETGMPWTPNGVKKWINNPILRGCVRGVWGQTEALITLSEWHEAQQLLSVRSRLRGRSSHVKHLFTGLVRCEGCGKNMHTTHERGKKRLKCKAAHCPQYGRGISYAVCRAKVIDALRDKAQALGAEAAASARPSAEEDKLILELEQLEPLAHLEAVQKQIDSHRRQLELLRQERSGDSASELAALFAQPGVLELASDEELRAIVLRFVSRIDWPGGLESLAVTLR